MANLKQLTRKKLEEVDFAGIANKMIEATAVNKDIVTFRNNHVTRVQAIAMRLAQGYENISIEMLMIACSIHDMHKYLAMQDEHGFMTAEFLMGIVDQWDMSPEERKNWKRVAHAVKFHSGAENMDEKCKKNPYLAILYDADNLDKLSVHYIKEYKELSFKDSSILDTMKYKCTNICIGYGYSKNYCVVKENMLKEALKLLDESERMQFVDHISSQFAEKTAKSTDKKKNSKKKKKK